MEVTSSVPTSQPRFRVRKAKVNNIGGNYIDNHHVQVVNSSNIVQQISAKDWRLTLLEEHISKGAAHDSYERDGLDTPKCHPETRAAVQGEIMSWIGYGDQDETPTRAMWLSGPAGSGKTAIAGSVADACQAKGWLAGSFFFSAYSGPPDRRSKRCVIPTLAYHLIHQKSIAGLKDRILSAIADTPSVFEKRIADQLEILILEPLRGTPVGMDASRWPKVIIVDGLDECGADTERKAGIGRPSRRSQEANQQEIISALVQACKDPAFPFRVLVVSRPEPAIRDTISTSSVAFTRLFLDEKYNPDADITLFLQAKFTDIGRRYNLPKGWLTQDANVVEVLVDRASGQFIYVVTAIRFIQDGKRSPLEQLKRVLEWEAYDTSEPFSALDSLYLGIIETSPNPPLAMKYLLATSMVRSEGSLSKGWQIKWLLEGLPGEMEHLLENLTSLIDLGRDGDEGPAPSLKFYHKSLADFLRDRNRSATLHESLCSIENVASAETILQTFIEDRVFHAVKSRGSQGMLSIDVPDGQGAVFDRRLSQLLCWTISSRHPYNPTDVDWWWSSLANEKEDDETFAIYNRETIEWTYDRVHKDCRRFKCQDNCKVWRKGIKRHCRASGIRKDFARWVELLASSYGEKEFLAQREMSSFLMSRSETFLP